METDWHFHVLDDGEYAGVIDVLHDSGESLMRIGDPAESYRDIAHVRAFAEHYERLKAQRDTLLRAIAEHKETESRFCNKCGYFGSDERHPGCNYSAAPSVRDQKLYQAASLIGEEGDRG